MELMLTLAQIEFLREFALALDEGPDVKVRVADTNIAGVLYLPDVSTLGDALLGPDGRAVEGLS